MLRRFPYACRFALLFSASAVLFSCSSEPPKPAEGSPEALLAAEGEWALVEDKQAPSPQQKHMQSRKQVNPSQTQGHNAYTKTVAESDANDDVHFRVLRLERQMNALQGDFDKILPPLSQRAQADRALNEAVEDIQGRQQGFAAPEPTKVPEPMKLADKPAKKPEQPRTASAARPAVQKPEAAKAQKPASGALAVTGVRLGDHPGKSRIVLDLSAQPKFSAELDSAENIVLVELPGAAWSAPAQKTYSNHPLIKSYSAQSSDGITRLVIELKKSAKIGMKEVLPPNPTYANHRIVLDLVF